MLEHDPHRLRQARRLLHSVLQPKQLSQYREVLEHHVNILSANVSTNSDRLAISRYVFEMGDTVHLDRVLNAVRRIDGVYDVYRVTSS